MPPKKEINENKNKFIFANIKTEVKGNTERKRSEIFGLFAQIFNLPINKNVKKTDIFAKTITKPVIFKGNPDTLINLGNKERIDVYNKPEKKRVILYTSRNNFIFLKSICIDSEYKVGFG